MLASLVLTALALPAVGVLAAPTEVQARGATCPDTVFGFQWAVSSYNNDGTYQSSDATYSTAPDPQQYCTSHTGSSVWKGDDGRQSDYNCWNAKSTPFNSTIGGWGGTMPNGQANTNNYYLYNTSCQTHVSYYTLNLRGYISSANAEGNYTITFGNVEKLALLWVGDKAKSGYTRANADIDTLKSSNKKFTFYLLGNNYMPIRIFYYNAERQDYRVSFFVKITDPNGKVIADENSKPNRSLVQYSCDGTQGAGMWPEFGDDC